MTTGGDLRDTKADTLLDSNQKYEASKAATILKNDARAASEAWVRQVRDLIKANGVAADKYAALGIPSSPGASGESVSATVPVATVDTSERLRHTINFADAATPNFKRKPAGTDGCEIWLKKDGVPPGSEKDCVFLALDTRTPYVVEFDAADAGKMAHYMLRWQFKDGSKSAWGETVSATITG